MKTFKDTADREWDVALTVESVMRINDLAGVNLAGADVLDAMQRLANDTVVFANVIWAMCKPQAESRSVAQSEFWKKMSGDSVNEATEALLEEIVNFTRNPRLRGILLQALKQQDSVMNDAMDIMEQNMDGAVKKAKATVMEGVSALFGNARESSDSTPAPSP